MHHIWAAPCCGHGAVRIGTSVLILCDRYHLSQCWEQSQGTQDRLCGWWGSRDIPWLPPGQIHNFTQGNKHLDKRQCSARLHGARYLESAASHCYRLENWLFKLKHWNALVTKEIKLMNLVCTVSLYLLPKCSVFVLASSTVMQLPALHKCRLVVSKDAEHLTVCQELI